MKLSSKIAAYKNLHSTTEGIEFGKRNLILATLANDLGLKHWIGENNTFELKHPSRRVALLVLPQ